MSEEEDPNPQDLKIDQEQNECSYPESFNMDHFELSLAQAREALDNGEVAIGCVFVDVVTDEVLTANRNRVNETKNATRHAEINCIDDIISKRKTTAEENHDVSKDISWHNIDVYVTCEPCIQCARLLRHLRVRRVIYGCSNDRFGGCRSVVNVADSVSIADEPPLEYIHGVKCDEAVNLLKTFYEGENLNAPEDLRKIKQPKR